MSYEKIKNLDDDKFRRLTGMKRVTFNKSVDILKETYQGKRLKGGRNSKLGMEDMLLMTLEYLREYRTYFHISKSYGISESSVYKAIKWVEDTLVKHPMFALPGRRELLKSEIDYEVVLIDATETPIERPKKSKENFILARRKDIP